MKILALVLAFVLSSTAQAFPYDSVALNYPVSGKALSEAMTKAYGNFDADLSTSKVESIKGVCMPNQFITTNHLGYLITACADRRELIGNNCHACGLKFGVLEFESKFDQFVFLKAYPIVGEEGSSGILPPVSIEEAGKDLPVLKFVGTYGGQGVESSYTRIYSLDETPHLIFEHELSEGTQPFCSAGSKLNPCWGWRGQMSIVTDGAAYGQITIQKSGTNRPKNKTIKVDTKPENFCFVDKKYVVCRAK